MIHMNVYLLSDAKIWQFTAIYFHKSSFMPFFGPCDESQSNGLSNDHELCNKIQPSRNPSSIVC